MFHERYLIWVQFLTALQILCPAASSRSPIRGKYIITWHLSVEDAEEWYGRNTWSVSIWGQAAEQFYVSDSGGSGTTVVVPRMVCHTEEVVQQGEELSVYLLHSGWDLTLFWKETALPWGRLGMLDMDKVMEFRVKQTDREREQEWAVNREPVVQHQGERHLGEVSDLPTCRRNRPRAKL